MADADNIVDGPVILNWRWRGCLGASAPLIYDEPSLPQMPSSSQSAIASSDMVEEVRVE